MPRMIQPQIGVPCHVEPQVPKPRVDIATIRMLTVTEDDMLFVTVDLEQPFLAHGETAAVVLGIRHSAYFPEMLEADVWRMLLARLVASVNVHDEFVVADMLVPHPPHKVVLDGHITVDDDDEISTTCDDTRIEAIR